MCCEIVQCSILNSRKIFPKVRVARLICRSIALLVVWLMMVAKCVCVCVWFEVQKGRKRRDEMCARPLSCRCCCCCCYRFRCVCVVSVCECVLSLLLLPLSTTGHSVSCYSSHSSSSSSSSPISQFPFQSMNPVETSLSRKSFRSVSSESRMPIALRRPRSPDSTAIRMFRRCSRSLRIR